MPTDSGNTLPMNWQDRIIADPKVLVGKPVIKGTRIAVEFLMELLSEGGVLLTFDKDFGELVFRRGRSASHGVILLRPRLRSPSDVARFVLQVLSRNVGWEGHFTVAREGMLRSAPLP